MKTAVFPATGRYTAASMLSNAKEQEAKAHLSVEQVRADMEACHQRLLSRLAELPDDSLKSGGRLARRIRQDTYDHYREHTLHVVEWRQQRDP